jgi:hypothetical protein
MFSGKSHEKIVLEKDPGNRENFVLLPGSVLTFISGTVVSLLRGHMGHFDPVFRKVLREICTEKRSRK